VSLSINYIGPEFLLKALHESDHHNHHIHPQGYPDHSKERKEGNLPAGRK